MFTSKAIYKRFRFVLLLFLIAQLLIASEAKALVKSDNEANGTSGNDEGVNLTVYNQNRALIKENRKYNLDKGTNRFSWENIAATIDIHSVNLRSLNSDKNFTIEEENYLYDLLTPWAVLQHAVGRTVLLHSADDKNPTQKVTLLGLQSVFQEPNRGINSGQMFPVLYKESDKYVISYPKEIDVDELPTGLVIKPQLEFTVDSAKAGPQNLALMYEANGINWQCDYMAVLDSEQDKINITGLVALDNRCGLNFRNANLKLIAGDVSTNVRPMAIRLQLGSFNEQRSPVQEGSFADYHLYKFPKPIDINNNETKRLVLLEKHAVPVTKKYIFEQEYYGYRMPKQKIPVQVKLEFENDKSSKQPLPAGQMKIYQEDMDHDLQIVGEDNISHTPIGEKVTVKLGAAFDVVGEKTHISSESRSEHARIVRIEKYKVSFNNHLNKDIVINDIEHIPDLAVPTSDSTFTKIDSTTIHFDVKVPANGSSEINYQLEIK